MKSTFQLRTISDPIVRDLTRGLLDRKAALRDQRTTLGRLLSIVDANDLYKVDAAFRESPLYSHLDIREEFPSSAPFEDSNGLSLVPDGSLAVRYTAHRISENSKVISESLELFRLLNIAIFNRDDKSIELLIESILALLGHSLVLARKAAVVVGYAPKDSNAFRVCTDLLASYGANGKNYGIMATIDAISLDFNYLDLKSRFREFARIDSGTSIMRKISYMCFTPITLNRPDAARLVAASYNVSILDAAFTLLAHAALGTLEADVPDEVVGAWSKLCEMPESARCYFPGTDPYADLHAFRAAPAFLEYDRFRKLRLSLQPVYDLPDSRTMTIEGTNPLSAEFFSSVERVHDLVPSDRTTVEPVPVKFDPIDAGILARTCAVVWACDRNPDFANIGKAELARLMGRTIELDRLIPTAALRRGASTANDQFVQLILQTLLRAHSSATRDSYNFKERFQKYVREHHSADIIRFMEEVRSLSENVVHYYINLLDETMLSQMAFLMPSSNAIYETRAKLLEWYADVADDEMSRDKARQLRLDRKIAAVRGVINETRLNIDGVRFRQWIEQNKLTDLSDFIRQANLTLPPIGELTDTAKSATRLLSAHREPTTRALIAISECYDEFCRNPDFGIASFLGRRIRHGTLRGTLLNGLPDEASIDVPPQSLSQYDVWRSNFSSSINAFAGRLYFRDKVTHKDSLLSAEIITPQQWQICLVCLKAIYEQAQKDMGILFAPTLIEQYCWFMFESELTKARGSIGEARAKWGTLKLRHAGDEASAAFERNVNIAVGDQFSIVASWFRKPPNISPVAELDNVMRVVLQEARDEFPTFSPQITFIGKEDLQLSGAAYYVAYDALAIAVRNAAKHGRHPGCLLIKVEVQDSGSAKLLAIEVESQLKMGDSVSAALQRIEEAGRAGPQDADVFEHGSGMPKFHKMRSERRITSFESYGSPGCSDRLCVSFTIPLEGLVE